MERLTESAFWNVAHKHVVDSCGSIERAIELGMDDVIDEARKISRLAIVEGTFNAEKIENAYLLGSILLHVYPPDIDMVKDCKNEVIRDYLLKTVQSEIPGDFPPVIEIGTCTRCTRRCRSCVPRDNLPDLDMDDKTWTAFADQMEEIFSECPKKERPPVIMQWYNEPLLDEKFEWRLEDLRARGVDYCIVISNGDLLDQKKALELAEFPFYLIITTKDAKTYDKLEELNASGKNILVIDHAHYHDEVRGFNRCNAVYKRKNVDVPRGCSSGPRIQVDVDGGIYMCCNDMLKLFKLGDIKTDKIMDIWHSKKMRKIRKLILAREYTGLPCKYCTHDFYGPGMNP